MAKDPADTEDAINTFVMAGLDPPAGPKPLRRGEGPAIHVLLADIHHRKTWMSATSRFCCGRTQLTRRRIG